ncbi:unnamed protein product [Caenorhabditis auriculariae]|uniref:proline--tRNA ligase n=1 Tax=Caenorhabditis auriculariae TaxID=2777116 RepID=A0A8S1GPV0_9PELO|nr:unnamed protein product [Caenorhabditis auriculariae]
MQILKARKLILNGLTPGSSKSLAHSLLLANGFIHPVGKGLYSILPLGQRVIDRICRILDAELQRIGAQKVSFPILGSKVLWDKTGRWESMGPEMMTLKDRTETPFCLQPTAEEMCTETVLALSPLKKNLFPLMLYQISEKFRDEMNPRFGLLRSRQFLMKDLYSFDRTYEDSLNTYKAVCKVYDKFFKNILQLEVHKTAADSGIHGGQLSHEYHLKSLLEEDFVDFCDECGTSRKPEISPPCTHESQKCSLRKLNTVEIAHTFHLGKRYSEVMNVNFEGKPLDMCCFGIGVTRLLPAVVDCLSVSAEAMRFPKAIAPFDAVVIPKKTLMKNVLLEMLLSSSKDMFSDGGVLLDDRTEISVGKRMRDANRLGIPYVIVLANETERSLENQSPAVELFSTEPKSAELVSHGAMSLTQLVSFVQRFNANSPVF